MSAALAGHPAGSNNMRLSFPHPLMVWSGHVERYRQCNYVCMVITYRKGFDQPGKVANPARGQLNKEKQYFPVRVGA